MANVERLIAESEELWLWRRAPGPRLHNIIAQTQTPAAPTRGVGGAGGC
jgi:hypothetical protein